MLHRFSPTDAPYRTVVLHCFVAPPPPVQGATKETAEESIIFGLDMAHAVLNCSGSSLVLAEPLARLVQASSSVLCSVQVQRRCGARAPFFSCRKGCWTQGGAAGASRGGEWCAGAAQVQALALLG